MNSNLNFLLTWLKWALYQVPSNKAMGGSVNVILVYSFYVFMCINELFLCFAKFNKTCVEHWENILQRANGLKDFI